MGVVLEGGLVVDGWHGSWRIGYWSKSGEDERRGER